MSWHATLVEVGGVGVLLLGPSGIGKSECALELVRRGHRLVADDRVEIRRDADGRPVGRADPRVGHHMEIRGLGILSLPDLFGSQSVLEAGRVDLACRLLRPADDPAAFDRVGSDRPLLDVEGARVPCVTLPAHSAGSLATLVEVAARDHALRAAGVNAAARFDEQLRRAMRES
jgi:HPr kinase/phosphorylase